MAGNVSKIYIEVEVDGKGGIKVLRQIGDESKKTGKVGARAFHDMDRSAVGFNRRIQNSHKQLLKWGGVLLGGYGLKRIGSDFLDVASSFEQMEVKLDALTKGHGPETLAAINKWALDMPVNTRKAVDTFAMMQAMGLDPTIAKMQTLVDVSSIFGEEAMPRVARAMGQMQTLGKLSAEELNQMAEAGINARKYLTQAFGMTVTELQKSKVSIDQIVNAIWQGLNADYSGAAQKAQHSWKGIWATFISYTEEAERQFMAAGVFEEIKTQMSGVNEELSLWIKNNGALIAQRVPEYLEKTKSGLQKIWDITSYDPAILEWGIVGLAFGGKKWALIGGSMAHMASWAQHLGEAMGMASQGILTYKEIAEANFKELDDLVKKGEQRMAVLAAGGKTFKIGPDTKGYDIYKPSKPKPTKVPAPEIEPFDWDKYWNTEEGKIAMSKALANVEENAHEEWRLRSKYSEATAADIAKHEALMADFKKAQLDKSKEAYAAAYDYLQFKSDDYYDYRIAQIRAETDAIAAATGDQVLAYQVYIERVKELDQERLEAAGETNQALIDLSERTSDAIEQTFSDVIYDLKDGWKDWHDYFRKLGDSMWRITSDIVGQMVKEWLFGTAKTTAALATEGAQVGVLTQLYYQLAAAKALAGALGGVSSSFGDMGSLSNIFKYGGGSFMARQHGGDVWPGQRFIVGEKGWEIFEPKVPGYIIPHHQAVNEKPGQTAGSGDLNISVPVTIDTGNERLASKLAYEMEETARRVLKEELR